MQVTVGMFWGFWDFWDETVGLEDRDYMRQRHPRSCTCAVCIGERGRDLTPEEYNRVKRLLEGTPKTRTHIKRSAIIASVSLVAGIWIVLTLPQLSVVEFKQCLIATLNEVSRPLELAAR
jgi:hypothetical protein